MKWKFNLKRFKSHHISYVFHLFFYFISYYLCQRTLISHSVRKYYNFTFIEHKHLFSILFSKHTQFFQCFLPSFFIQQSSLNRTISHKYQFGFSCLIVRKQQKHIQQKHDSFLFFWVWFKLMYYTIIIFCCNTGNCININMV